MDHCKPLMIVNSEWVSERILNGTSAQFGYTVPFTSLHAGKDLIEDNSETQTIKTKENPDINTVSYSTVKITHCTVAKSNLENLQHMNIASDFVNHRRKLVKKSGGPISPPSLSPPSHLPLPPFPSGPHPSRPLPFPSSPLEAGPLNPARGSGGAL